MSVDGGKKKNRVANDKKGISTKSHSSMISLILCSTNNPVYMALFTEPRFLLELSRYVYGLFWYSFVLNLLFARSNVQKKTYSETSVEGRYYALFIFTMLLYYYNFIKAFSIIFFLSFFLTIF